MKLEIEKILHKPNKTVIAFRHFDDKGEFLGLSGTVVEKVGKKYKAAALHFHTRVGVWLTDERETEKEAILEAIEKAPGPGYWYDEY